MMPGGFEALFQLGATAAVLSWFMYTATARFTAIEKAINRLSQVQLLDIMARESLSETAKREAQRLLKELEMEGARG